MDFDGMRVLKLRGNIQARRLSPPWWGRKDFLGFSFLAKSLENPREGAVRGFANPLSGDF
jgi:hypothetical protein